MILLLILIAPLQQVPRLDSQIPSGRRGWAACLCRLSTRCGRAGLISRQDAETPRQTGSGSPDQDVRFALWALFLAFLAAWRENRTQQSHEQSDCTAFPHAHAKQTPRQTGNGQRDARGNGGTLWWGQDCAGLDPGGRIMELQMNPGRPVLRSSRSEGGHRKPQPGVSFMCRPESMWTPGGSRA